MAESLTSQELASRLLGLCRDTEGVCQMLRRAAEECAAIAAKTAEADRGAIHQALAHAAESFARAEAAARSAAERITRAAAGNGNPRGESPSPADG